MYEEIIMKKLSTLFTTTMIALALMMAAPSAMADKDKLLPGNGKDAVALCAAWAAASPATFDLFFKNQGQCVATARSGKFKFLS